MDFRALHWRETEMQSLKIPVMAVSAKMTVAVAAGSA
jgi:hypothetical protein